MIALEHSVAVLAGPAGKVRVSPNEMRILGVLLDGAGRFIPSREIIASVWLKRPPRLPYDALRVHVSAIRRKFPRIGLDPADIEGIYHEGYRLRGAALPS